MANYIRINKNDMERREFGEFGSARFIMITDECWMSAADIGKCLQYNNPRESLRKFVSQENKVIVMAYDNDSNRSHKFTLINENGLNELVLHSKAPRAKEFQHWIANVVIPEMNHNDGNYLTEELQDMIMNDPEAAITYMQELSTKNKRLKKEKAEEEELRRMFECSKGSCSVGTLAKVLSQRGYDIGRNRMIGWLQASGYLCTQDSCYNVPVQKYINNGYFEVNIKKLISYTTTNPKRFVHIPMITPKGQIEITRAFIKWYKTCSTSVPKCVRDYNFEITADEDYGFTRLHPKQGGRFEQFLKHYSKRKAN